MHQLNKYYKIVIAIIELILSVPLLGFTIVALSGWTILGWMMFFHIIGIVLSFATKQKKSGHIIGLIGNWIAFIPFIGMISHGIIGLILLIQGVTTKSKEKEQ